MIMIRLFSLFVIFCFLFNLQASTEVNLDSNLSFLVRKGMEIVKYNSSGESSKIYHVEFNLDKLFYNVEVISPVSAENAQAIINNNYFILLKSFEATPTPYVGQITKVQDCNSTSKPTITKLTSNNIPTKLISFSSDSTLRPGVCVQRKLAVEVCHAYIFVPNIKSLVKIKSNSKTGGKCLQSTLKFLEEMKF